jgi:hypothetical protein
MFPCPDDNNLEKWRAIPPGGKKGKERPEDLILI